MLLKWFCYEVYGKRIKFYSGVCYKFRTNFSIFHQNFAIIEDFEFRF